MIARRFLAASALVLGLSACSQPGKSHWLRVADGSGDLSTLNPHLAMGASLDDVAQLTQAYFVRFDARSRPMPELLSEIPSKQNRGIAADGLSITWHLRRGVRWSDGAPFDARDVVFSTHAILNPANNEAQGTTGWNLIRAIESPDRYTVVYRLKEPYGALVTSAFAPVGGGPCLLPAHILERLPDINTAAYNALPIGIGPFRITRWKRGDAIEMEANPFYWRGRPRLDHVTYEILPSRETLLAQMRTGEVDLWPRVPPAYVRELAAVPAVRLVKHTSLRTTHLDFMMTPDALADKAVRQAIRLGIDRPAIIRTVEHGYGTVSDSIVWPPFPAKDDDRTVARPDPARARALLAADGWLPGPDGVRLRRGRRLRLTMPYQSGSPDLDSLVELIRAQLRPLGIELNARRYTHTVLFAPKADGGILDNGRYDAILYSSTLTSLPDLASNFDCAQVPPNGENATHWCDPRVPALLRTMRRSYDAAEVGRAFAQLNRIFIDEVPSIQLFVWSGNTAINARVDGYRDNLLTSFDEMRDVDVR